ncbi:MAG: hypothetical protein AAFS10_17150 [Myxococcota bacterium]
MPTRYLWIGPALALTLLGCIEDAIESQIEDELDDRATVADRACQAFTGGDAEEVTAAPDTSGAIPAVNNGPQLYTVTLSGDSPPREGALQFTPSSAGEYLILVTGAVPFELQSASGTPFANTQAPVTCDSTTVPDGYTARFQADTPYNLTFGPTSANGFSLVIALDPNSSATAQE